MGGRAYVVTVLALCAVILLPATGLNLLLSANSLRADKNRLASEWQQATHGVTYAPPISYNRPFKTLRLNDRIGEINAVIFGSSTTMGIVEGAFPHPLKPYNFAQSGNSLGAVIGEAEYIVQSWGDRVTLLVIPLDWALGFVFESGEPQPAELTPEAVLRAAALARPPLSAQLADALSRPRLQILATALRDVMRASAPVAAFRQIFLDAAGSEYRCADGTLARDFDVVYRGLCNGFRYDGSATFADQKRLDASRAPVALAAAVSGSGQYATALRKGGGNPTPALLARIARLVREAEGKGGSVLLLLPPLMPGMEQALARSPHSGALLAETKSRLAAWARRERIALLDAGRSERYDCTVTEFIDPHHALPACYRKVFSRYFREHPPMAIAAPR